MKLAIMQPYFMPYIGYFQLIGAVDKFVIYDDIQYSKKGWINRNRILANGNAAYISLPLKKDSDYLDIRDRHLAESWFAERTRMLNKLRACYAKAPYFADVYPLLEKAILFESGNLFDFLHNAIRLLMERLDIQTDVVVSSSLAVDRELKAEARVVATCRAMEATEYLNPIGGVELYSKDYFERYGIELRFLKADDIRYPQLKNAFVPSLSIIDVLMFNSVSDAKRMIREDYTLIQPL